jgi:hypothetical protein
MRFLACRLLLICGAVVLMLPRANAQESSLNCPAVKGQPPSVKYQGYTVRLVRSSDRGFRCEAFVAAPGSKSVRGKAVAKDWALSVNPLSGSDVNGDGKPDLILEGFSGGAHCCYTYQIITLTAGLPEAVHQMRNQVPISFVKRDSGGAEVRTSDGVFDYFLLPHVDSVIPEIFLLLDGNKLVDAGPDHVADYDKLIDKARSELTPEELEKLKKATYNQNMLIDQLPTVKKVLTIVLNYLYSGRQEQAWSALNEMWPPSDADRVKRLIVERRGRGLLSTAVQKGGTGL